MAACPSNCRACTYDSTQGKTMCGNNQCENQYANAADGTCGGLRCYFRSLLNKCVRLKLVFSD